MKEIQKLNELFACKEGILWLETQETYEQAWQNCQRGDWMLRLLYMMLDGTEAAHRKFILAKARCAMTVFHLMKDERSRNAVLVAEKYGLGESSLEELKSAADNAFAAVIAATVGVAAAYVAYAATDATAFAATNATACVASGVIANSAAAEVKKENRLLTANIIRELYKEPPILF